MPARMELPVKARVLLSSNATTPDGGMTAALQSAGCEVILANGHRQALSLARRRRIDVLVLDFGDQFQALLEFASTLSATARCFRTLVLTSSLQQLALAGEMPVHAVLLKPLTSEQIRAVIDNLLAGLQAQTRRGGLEPVPFHEVLSAKHDWETNE